MVHLELGGTERSEALRRLEALGLVAPETPTVVGGLSPRERAVLRLVAEGQTNREIGRSLGISERTAKFHVLSLFNKLGVNTRAQAVAAAARGGLL